VNLKEIKMTRRNITIIVMMLALILSLAACGSSPDGDGNNSGTGSTGTGSETGTEAQDGSDTTGDGADGADAANRADITPAGEDVVIPVSEITGIARFYPTETEDGTAVEILALAAPDGTIRTAFNTCQVCYSSGHGYYVQDGDMLVCQNCGNRFDAARVEIESGGCNPVPIFTDNKTVTDDTITISADFIAQAKDIFSNWKA
jgi:hypothetical protein